MDRRPKLRAESADCKMRTSGCFVSIQPGMKRIGGQFARYVLSGIGSALVHYALLIALVESGVPVVPASCAGATAGVAASYLLNYHFTFRSNEPHGPALSKFLVVTAGGWVINAAAMILLVETVDAHYLVLQTVALAGVILFNFSGFRWFAFRARL